MDQARVTGVVGVVDIIGSAETEAPDRNLHVPNSFARVLNEGPGYLGINPNLLEAADLQLVDIDNIRTGLFGVIEGFAIDGVALLPEEYQAYPRNVGAMLKSVGATTLKAQGIDPSLDRRLAVAGRSRVHAAQSKADRLEAMMVTLKEEHDSLSTLLARIDTKRGLAHNREARMRVLVGNAIYTFGRMLDVVALQKGWDEQTRSQADLALFNRLTIGDYDKKHAYWRNLMALAITYNQARSGLARNRLAVLARKARAV